MRLSEFYIKEQEESIEAVQKEVDRLEIALSSARDITKGIKYEDTTMNIVSQMSTLAEESGIDPNELDYYERQVFEAKNRLESTIYELEEVFEDKLRDARNKLDELEYEAEYGSD